MPYPGFGVWLDEKLTCIANQWGGLLALLCDGRVEIDSNFAGDRSRLPGNALFADDDEGAAARAASIR